VRLRNWGSIRSVTGVKRESSSLHQSPFKSRRTQLRYHGTRMPRSGLGRPKIQNLYLGNSDQVGHCSSCLMLATAKEKSSQPSSSMESSAASWHVCFFSPFKVITDRGRNSISRFTEDLFRAWNHLFSQPFWYYFQCLCVGIVHISLAVLEHYFNNKITPVQEFCEPIGFLVDVFVSI
jgi:hypothetical protein